MSNITLEEYEQIHPNMEYLVNKGVRSTPIRFFTPNRHCAWRVESLDTKEPDTIAWLAKMKLHEVLFDVGANMGQYSLIAAARGLTVHAFEPESQNFALLMRNILLNNMGNSVTAWPLALSNSQDLDLFHAQNLQAGGSCSSFGSEVNFHLRPKQYAVHQGCFSYRMIDFCNERGIFPNHVKIDVDGLEHKVVEGMGNLLDSVDSVLVEINTALPEHLAIIETMKAHGLTPDMETADTARRTEGAFAGIGNVIFYRQP